ncbi:hypothetical protein P4S95_07505 [Aneurinibacillus aneurinilyticus]|uniref:hypothetical protein n=1 Tax=Aneurinibacillus aneurinilyticus TaxID=1391 RepID=UPI002E1CF858|nr:hypothetical protein [Aneurinibacillus aneurinilyticus]
MLSSCVPKRIEIPVVGWRGLKCFEKEGSGISSKIEIVSVLPDVNENKRIAARFSAKASPDSFVKIMASEQKFQMAVKEREGFIAKSLPKRKDFFAFIVAFHKNLLLLYSFGFKKSNI